MERLPNIAQIIKSVCLPRWAIWKNKDFDQLVYITGKLGKFNGITYYSHKDGASGIPGNQLTFK